MTAYLLIPFLPELWFLNMWLCSISLSQICQACRSPDPFYSIVICFPPWQPAGHRLRSVSWRKVESKPGIQYWLDLMRAESGIMWSEIWMWLSHTVRYVAMRVPSFMAVGAFCLGINKKVCCKVHVGNSSQSGCFKSLCLPWGTPAGYWPLLSYRNGMEDSPTQDAVLYYCLLQQVLEHDSSGI